MHWGTKLLKREVKQQKSVLGYEDKRISKNRHLEELASRTALMEILLFRYMLYQNISIENARTVICKSAFIVTLMKIGFAMDLH